MIRGDSMRVWIEVLSKENLRDVFEFERDNRAYFEKVLPPRPKEYGTYESFLRMMDALLQEQENKMCYLCLVRDNQGKMVGRVNLSTITYEGEISAELGYRFSENEQGKGYASEAVRLIIEEGVSEFGLQVVEAGTGTENHGSQKVLIKNGFSKIGEEKHVMQIKGNWIDGVLFEKIIEQ